jgi:dihydropteroate synthase
MGRFPPIALSRRALAFDRTAIVAVINVTPDSFSRDGRHSNVESAVAFALRCVDQGADVLDIGGESTRPGAGRITATEEIARVLPVIERLVATQPRAAISVDTTKVEVAQAALEAGADLVNDISGGRFEPQIVDLVADRGAAYICGHVRGSTLAQAHAAEERPPTFDEVAEELAWSLARAPASLRQRTIVDPCLGFGKRKPQNLELLARAGELGARLARPVLVGPSRKRFLGEITGRAVDDRDDATVGACLAAVAAGADAVRVHDVKRVRDALLVFEAVRS